MIWCGFITPCSVSSRRTAMSVIDPGPWWPRIGMPSILAMSTASPVECSETLPADVSSECPQLRLVTVGLRPDAAEDGPGDDLRADAEAPEIAVLAPEEVAGKRQARRRHGGRRALGRAGELGAGARRHRRAEELAAGAQRRRVRSPRHLAAGGGRRARGGVLGGQGGLAGD